jgi:hypothetical protein
VTLRLRLIVSIGVALLASLALGAALTFWHAGYQVQTEVRAAIAVAMLRGAPSTIPSSKARTAVTG